MELLFSVLPNLQTTVPFLHLVKTMQSQYNRWEIKWLLRKDCRSKKLLAQKQLIQLVFSILAIPECKKLSTGCNKCLDSGGPHLWPPSLKAAWKPRGTCLCPWAAQHSQSPAPLRLYPRRRRLGDLNLCSSPKHMIEEY